MKGDKKITVDYKASVLLNEDNTVLLNEDNKFHCNTSGWGAWVSLIRAFCKITFPGTPNFR